MSKSEIDASHAGQASIERAQAEPDRCLVYFDDMEIAHCSACAEKFSDYMVYSSAVFKLTDNNICDLDHELVFS